MKNASRVLAIVLAMALCLAHMPASQAQTRSPDAEALQELAKSGSDLSKLHGVGFFLRFPTEEGAAHAASQLEELAFATTTERAEAGGAWVILASKVMYLVESDLMGLRNKLDIVATERGGIYEGWQARVAE